LANDDVYGKFAVNPVSNPKDKPARVKKAVGFRDVFANQIRHVDFTPMNGDAHGRDSAQKCGGRQDEHKKRHPAYPFQSLSESHKSWPIAGFLFAL
jgi:hypothetical protein